MVAINTCCVVLGDYGNTGHGIEVGEYVVLVEDDGTPEKGYRKFGDRSGEIFYINYEDAPAVNTFLNEYKMMYEWSNYTDKEPIEIKKRLSGMKYYKVTGDSEKTRHGLKKGAVVFLVDDDGSLVKGYDDGLCLPTAYIHDNDLKSIN